MMTTVSSLGASSSVSRLYLDSSNGVPRDERLPHLVQSGKPLSSVLHFKTKICKSASKCPCVAAALKHGDCHLNENGEQINRVDNGRRMAGLSRRLVLALSLALTPLKESRASASAFVSEISPAPYSNPILRSLGIGDPDIYYPKFFEGTWNCYSTLIEVATPQGDEKADQKSVEFSRKQLGYTSLVEATVGKNVIEKGQWDPAKPNRLILVLKGGTKVENLVTKRSAEYFQEDQFDTSEFSKQVFDYSAIRDGPPTVKASQNLTRYHWDTMASTINTMEAIQKVSMFAVPMEGMEMFNTKTPVTIYKYRIEFERV